MREPSFTDVLLRVIDADQVPRKAFQVEITENTLLENGDVAQGYHFCRPLEADAFADLIARQ